MLANAIPWIEAANEVPGNSDFKDVPNSKLILQHTITETEGASNKRRNEEQSPKIQRVGHLRQQVTPRDSLDQLPLGQPF